MVVLAPVLRSLPELPPFPIPPAPGAPHTHRVSLVEVNEQIVLWREKIAKHERDYYFLLHGGSGALLHGGHGRDEGRAGIGARCKAQM